MSDYDRLVADLGRLADEWERSDDRTWVSNCGGQLRDLLPTTSPVAAQGGGDEGERLALVFSELNWPIEDAREAADAVLTSNYLADRDRATKAAAWDEGYDMGDPYQRRGNPDEGKHRNPYRDDRTEQR